MTGEARRHAVVVASVFCAAVVHGSPLQHVGAGALQTSEFADFHNNRVRKVAAGVQISEAVRGRRLESCEVVAITGGDFAGSYTLDGQLNGSGAFYNADRTAALWYQERIEEGDDDGERRSRALMQTGISKGPDRRLGACSGGFWTNGPAAGGYPQLRVSDCASHPADIKVMEWFEVTCADCAEADYAGEDPVVSCLDDASSLTSGSSSSQGDDAAIVEDGSSLVTPAPAASSSGATDESCRVLDVTGEYPDLYERVGTYNSRGDYYSSDQAYNIFFERVQNTQTATIGPGNNRRQRMLREVLAASDAGVDREYSRRLAACDTGYWIITPTGGGYPFYAASDCAIFPEDIADSTEWLEVSCATCDSAPASSPQEINCATGEDAVVETPAPVPPIETGPALGPSLPGGGTTSCEFVTVTGAEAGAYTVVGEVNDRADLRSDDGLFRFYWGSPAPALERRRRHLSEAREEEQDFDPNGPFADRSLANCDGYWYITPLAALYPAYAVNDCAGHPADITSTDWVYLECEECDVEVVDPTPTASCTGAATSVKRGSPNLSTPAPTPFNPDATAAPLSAVVTTCQTVVLTGEVAGNYTATGTYRGKPDFFSDDGLHNLYFERVVRRQRDRALSGMGWPENGQVLEEYQHQKRALPGAGIHKAMSNAMESMESLAACSSGYWIIAPVSGLGYPVFGVADCADHPADIQASTWMIESCETCGVQDAPDFVSPDITCGEAISAEAGGNTTPTPAPAEPSTCGQVYVMGPAPGVYGQNGEYGGKGDFYSGDRKYNLYWVFYAGKPENRRLLQLRERGRARRRRSSTGSDEDASDAGEWSGEHGLALENLARDYRRAVEDFTQVTRDDVSRRLEFCEDGFWLITPRGGGFPFYGTQNCAYHPADIGDAAEWNMVECEGCRSQPVNETVTITCDKDSYVAPPTPAGVPTPAPVLAPTANGAENTTIDDAESSWGVPRVDGRGTGIVGAIVSFLVTAALTAVMG